MPCVANAMLIGDQRKFLSVLLTLKTEIDPVTMEPLPELTPATLAWCEGLGSKAKVRILFFSSMSDQIKTLKKSKIICYLDKI